MYIPSPRVRTFRPSGWILVLFVWICTSCMPDQFIVPPADARPRVDLPATLGCDLEAMSAAVSYDWLRLRSAPNLESKILKLLLKDEVYAVAELNRDQTWVQLQVEGVSQPAWVYAELVQLSCPPQVTVAAASTEGSGGSETSSKLVHPQVHLFMQKLEALVEESASDGGIPFAQELYMQETTGGDASPCDVPCEVIRGSQLADGSWFLPYEYRYTFDRSSLRVTHLLPLYELHQSGGWNGLPEWQIRYGYGALERDPGVRVLVSQEMLETRGDADPGIWLPKAGPGRCTYAMDWIRQKSLWQLAADSREKEALTTVLAACHQIMASQP